MKVFSRFSRVCRVGALVGLGLCGSTTYARAADPTTQPKDPGADPVFISKDLDAAIGVISNYYGVVSAAVGIAEYFLGPDEPSIPNMIQQLRSDILSELKSERLDGLTWTADSVTQDFLNTLANPNLQQHPEVLLQTVENLKNEANDVRYQMLNIIQQGTPEEAYRLAPHFVALAAVEMAMLKLDGYPDSVIQEHIRESIQTDYAVIGAVHGSCDSPLPNSRGTWSSWETPWPTVFGSQAFRRLVPDTTYWSDVGIGCSLLCDITSSGCECVDTFLDVPFPDDPEGPYDYCSGFVADDGSAYVQPASCDANASTFLSRFATDPVVRLVRADITALLSLVGPTVVSDPRLSAVELDYRSNSDQALDFSIRDCGFTDAPIGDWAGNSLKAQCAPNERVTGVSRETTGQYVHGVQCSNPSSIAGQFRQDGTCHPLMFDPGDNRPNPVEGDWDVGFYKADCGPDEYVAGVSQDLAGHVDGILCCAGTVNNPPSASCDNQVIENGDSRNYSGTDWDYGFWKAECPPGQYVRGVSAYPEWLEFPGAPHAIRCCSVTADSDNNPHPI